MLAVSGGQIVASSTPAGKRGWWYQAWIDISQDWQRVEVSATACARIPASFLERERSELGERHFNAEYYCSFEDNEAPETLLEQLADPDVQDWSGWLHADDLDKGAVVTGRLGFTGA
jgi:hypothetical protein